MKIIVRSNSSAYKYISIGDGNALIDLGIHDSKECIALANELMEAVEEIMRGVEDTKVQSLEKENEKLKDLLKMAVGIVKSPNEVPYKPQDFLDEADEFLKK